MAYTVKWKFDGGEEQQTFDSLETARTDADSRLLAYTETHGSTFVTIHDDQGERVYIRGEGHV